MMFHRLLVIITVLMTPSLAIVSPLTSPAAAEEGKATAESVTILHRPSLPSTIPPLGSLMEIRVELLNTVDIESKIRLVGSKDGRFIDIAFPRGALNNSDHPSFVIEIPSPAATMSYQFVLQKPDGSLMTSQRYILKRPCIQNFKVEVPESATAAFQTQIATLVAKAKELERDTHSLETSLKLLEEIKNLSAK